MTSNMLTDIISIIQTLLILFMKCQSRAKKRVTHTCNLSILETEADRLPSSLRSLWATKWVPGQLELQSEILSHKQEETEREGWGEICIYFIHVILVSMLFHK